MGYLELERKYIHNTNKPDQVQGCARGRHLYPQWPGLNLRPRLNWLFGPGSLDFLILSCLWFTNVPSEQPDLGLPWPNSVKSLFPKEKILSENENLCPPRQLLPPLHSPKEFTCSFSLSISEPSVYRSYWWMLHSRRHVLTKKILAFVLTYQ